MQLNKKYCPKCRQTSYSSCAEGIWVCPTCAHDLSQEPVLPLNSACQWKLRFDGVKPEHLRNEVRHLTVISSK